ncbi:porin [Hydrogenophaga sp. PBL-H3]|uniref:porin n=1 Tax=Hydrogenophaga sp. PBL-H3 TaxID=434010 RepID=UPI00131F8A8C|nr:porin [Hydrogenophaga sp. PBL-H3]QHE77616.1 porin [Hydrogenophaga sp. PBL-H3]QHE82040.1 porin [Hydrogenophaga sp. PBL-H3]
MKKTLIALAAVAATSASFAQSTVTLSGTVDVGLEKRFSGDALRMTSSRSGTSNWTLSGAEDLGGGLKAVFQVSTAFNADDGTLTAANTLGNNGMFVGLTGGFGTLRAGRPVNTLYGNAMFANGTKGVSLHDSNSVVNGNAAANAKNSGASNSVYVPNAVQYHTPRFGGVQVQFEYAPSESSAVGNKAGTGIAVRYDGGPLSVSFTNYTGAKAATSTLKSVNQIAAAYDFSVAKLFFTYRDQGGLAADMDTSYALGVTAPVGPGALYAAYNVNEQAGSDGRTVIAGYKYNLSKRTQAYVNLARRNAAWVPGFAPANGNTVPTGSSTGYGFGLTHNF